MHWQVAGSPLQAPPFWQTGLQTGAVGKRKKLVISFASCMVGDIPKPCLMKDLFILFSQCVI